MKTAWLTGPTDADFDTPASLLRRAGYIVTTPISVPTDGGLADSLRWIVNQVLSAETVVVLPDWQTSSSTDIEVSLAEAMGIPVLDLNEAVAVEPERLLA